MFKFKAISHFYFYQVQCIQFYVDVLGHLEMISMDFFDSCNVAVHFDQYHLLKMLSFPVYIFGSIIKNQVSKGVRIDFWGFRSIS